MTTEAVHIRKATPEDADALAQCIDLAYARYANRIPDLPAVSEGCADDIAANQVWVATQEREIIAGLFLMPQDGFIKLANLAVHPDHGGRGIARRLMEISEREALRQGYRELRLNTHAAMPENIQIYEHFGWRVISRNGNTVSMSKSLPPE